MKKTFKVEGMHCESCAKIIHMELDEKVKSANIDFKKGSVEVEFDEKKTTEQQIIEAITEAGYKVRKN